MADPIEAHYTPDGDDWTVAVTGRGRTLTGRAPGLIAARDRADQLVEQLAPEESGHKTVVHMLNGDAVEFTTAYLTARLARTEPPAPLAEAPADTAGNEEKPAEDEPPASQQTQSDQATPADQDKAAVQDKPTDDDKPAGQDDSAGEDEQPVQDPKRTGRHVPAPKATPEAVRPAAKPTPAPRTESQAGQPAAQPPAPTPAEEPASSGS